MICLPLAMALVSKDVFYFQYQEIGQLFLPDFLLKVDASLTIKSCHSHFFKSFKSVKASTHYPGDKQNLYAILSPT